MYLRHTIRKKDGKVHRYWRLVQSVRVGRRVVQQTVAQLGELDEQGRISARAFAQQIVGIPDQGQLFDDGTANLTVPVRLKGIRIERSRQFGEASLFPKHAVPQDYIGRWDGPARLRCQGSQNLRQRS